jgi:hypothetical protein
LINQPIGYPSSKKEGRPPSRSSLFSRHLCCPLSKPKQIEFLLGAAGALDNRDIGPDLHRLLRQFVAGRMGHGHVSDDPIERIRFRPNSCSMKIGGQLLTRCRNVGYA